MEEVKMNDCQGMRPEILVGYELAEKLMGIFYPNEARNQSCLKVSTRLTYLRHKSKIFYPDKDDVARFRILLSYSEQDLRDLFEMDDREFNDKNFYGSYQNIVSG
jgi:hypothetical protein